MGINIWFLIISNCHEYLDFKEYLIAKSVNRESYNFLKNEYIIPKLIQIDHLETILDGTIIDVRVFSNEIPKWSIKELLKICFDAIKHIFDYIIYIHDDSSKNEKSMYFRQIELLKILIHTPKSFTNELIPLLFPEYKENGYIGSYYINNKFIQIDFYEKTFYDHIDEIDIYNYRPNSIFDDVYYSGKTYICGNECTYDGRSKQKRNNLFENNFKRIKKKD